jgi:hypothetical protein
VVAVGARPLIGITLWYDASDANSALIPYGWEDNDVAAEGTIDRASLRACGLGDDTAPITWAQFRINPSWDGRGWNAAVGIGLRSQLGADGSRGWAASHPPVAALEFTSSFPGPDGARPAFTAVTYDDTAFEELSVGAPKCIGDRTGAARDLPAGIIILADTPAGAAALAERRSQTFLVTVGVREWAPIQAWALRSVGDRGAPPRLRTVQRTEARQMMVLPKTVIGPSPTVPGTLLLDTDGTTYQNDTAQLATLAADALVHLGVDRVAASWTWRGKIRTDRQPGDLVGSVQATTDQTYQVRGWIAEVRWSFVGMPSTMINVVPVDAEGVIA